MKKLLKIIAGLFFAALLLFIAVMLLAAYKIKHSEKVVTEFCNEIQLSDDIENVNARAESNKIYPFYADELADELKAQQQSFYVPGFIFNFYSCDVTLSKGKIISKEIIAHDD